MLAQIFKGLDVPENHRTLISRFLIKEFKYLCKIRYKTVSYRKFPYIDLVNQGLESCLKSVRKCVGPFLFER